MTAPWSVSRVAPETLPAVWPQIAAAARRGLRHGAGDSISEAQIVRGIETGAMELWAVHDGPSVTAGVVIQQARRPQGTALIVVLACGSGFHGWVETVVRLLEDYRDLTGAYTIEAVARPGMAKWLKALGWRPKATIMERAAKPG